MHSAELYQNSNLLQKRDALACLEKYAAKMTWKKDNNRIMDIGCGDGSVTNIFKSYFPSNFTLVGTDVSEEMVKFATDNNRDEQTRFMVLDIASDVPNIMRGNFDIVFSCFTFNWVMNQKRAFDNVFNLLDENGECLMLFLGYHPVFDVYRALSQNSKWSRWIYNIDSYISPYHDSEEPDKEIKALMEKIGFVNILVEYEDKVFLYDDINVMKNHMTAINPFKIPKDKNDDFMEDYIQELKGIELKNTDNISNTSRGLTVHYKLLTVFGRKCSNINDSTNIEHPICHPHHQG